MRNLKNNNGGFTLIELMVVVIIISILAIGAFRTYGTYIAKANDSTRLTHLTSLKGAIETYKTSRIAPPLNQYALVGAGMMSNIPVDPENGYLYQYAVDVRGWVKGYKSQGTSGNNFLLASNRPMESTDSQYYDGNEFKTEGYSTSIPNLKYFGGYLVVGGGDANFLTDNGKSDKTADNKYIGKVSGGPSTAPQKCGTENSDNGGKQLNVYNGTDLAGFGKKSSNDAVTLTEIYGKEIPGSACVLQIKSDGKGTSVVNNALNIDTIMGEGHSELYK